MLKRILEKVKPTLNTKKIKILAVFLLLGTIIFTAITYLGNKNQILNYYSNMEGSYYAEKDLGEEVQKIDLLVTRKKGWNPKQKEPLPIMYIFDYHMQLIDKKTGIVVAEEIKDAVMVDETGIYFAEISATGGIDKYYNLDYDKEKEQITIANVDSWQYIFKKVTNGTK